MLVKSKFLAAIKRSNSEDQRKLTARVVENMRRRGADKRTIQAAIDRMTGVGKFGLRPAKLREEENSTRFGKQYDKVVRLVC